jgi:16S rRNA U1498 N3-methylase RsmE
MTNKEPQVVQNPPNVTPFFQNVLRLFMNDVLSFILLDGSLIKGKIITYDQAFVVINIVERWKSNEDLQKEDPIIIPYTSIKTIRPMSKD